MSCLLTYEESCCFQVVLMKSDWPVLNMADRQFFCSSSSCDWCSLWMAGTLPVVG